MAPNCNFMRPLARDESVAFLLYLPTVCLFLQRLFALRRKRRSTIKLLRNKCSCRASSSSHRLKSAGALIMQRRTSIAKRVSKFNLDEMDEERDNRNGMPGKG